MERNITIPLKGMNTDIHQINHDEQTYTFALNAITSDFFTGNEYLLGNEPSNKCSVVFPIGYQVVGFVQIVEQNRTIFFLKNTTTGNSQIGEVANCSYKQQIDKIEQTYCSSCPGYVGTEVTPLEQQKETCYCTYRMIVDSDCLGFDVNYPVDIEYKITNCSLNLYFTDNLNERRFIYFDYEDDDQSSPIHVQERFFTQIGVDTGNCNIPIYNDVLDCEKLKFHPNYNKPCINFESLVNGGNLKAGLYQILIAYSDASGNPITNYFPASAGVSVFRDSITFETNYETNNAIKFSVSNLKIDGIFQYYNVVIAQTIENFTEFFSVATLPTTQNTYIYTGFEKTLKRLSPEEVFFRRPFYKKAKHVTTANNYLFFTSAEPYPTLNLQPIINNIKVGWQTVALKEDAYRDPRNVFYFKTYQRDEVYALGILIEFNNGRESCVFHLPGREANAYDVELISNEDVIQDNTCNEPVVEKPRWQVYNTASIKGIPHEYNENCDIHQCWEYGDFGYYESTDKYPNVPEVWGNLCGQPIRHHRFPDNSISHIHDGLNDKKTYKESNYIFPIGIYIDHSSVISAFNEALSANLITLDDYNSIKSYRIVRANRVGNKSVVAKGLLFNMFEYTKYSNKYYFPNYAYNDLSSDSFISDAVLSDYNRFTFHSPDTHFVNPNLGNILKLETEEYGESEGYFTYSDCQPKYKLLGTFSYLLALGLGIAAAISATGEKQCKVITYKNPSKIQPYTVDTSGNTPVGMVVGSSPGAISTTVANSAFTGHSNVPEITQNYNTAGIDTFNPTTGANVPSSRHGAEEQITTCKGQTFQVFNSHPVLQGLFGGANQIIQRTILGILEMEKTMQLLHTLIPAKKLSIQYNSVGKYNNYKAYPDNGSKYSLIEKSAYLKPILQSVAEPSSSPSVLYETININNWNRESSVYLKTQKDFPTPITIDTSKCSMSDVGFGMNDLNKTVNRSVSSFYASIKNNILNQYGQLCNIEYLETNSCSFELNKEYSFCESTVFGGDTFINRFALKRKMPFFKHTMCKLPDNSDVLYSELGNAGTPTFYFDTPRPLLDRISNLTDIFGIVGLLTSENDKNYDVHGTNIFYQNGYIHLFNYGIPYFLVESDINIDYRHGENFKEKNFYPNTTDLKQWLEEEIVPISEDNYYFYNRTYSKQNKESALCRSCIQSIKEFDCDNLTSNLLIYSEPSVSETSQDNWLIFKANNFHEFPLTLGKLITADGIENDKVLARLTKGIQIFPAYDTIELSGQTVQIGTGGIFKNRPVDIAITELGYAGTQHSDIVHTEYGHIWADAERGQVFNLANGGDSLNEISKDGMKSWFKQNLPFNIKKDFPNIDIDGLDNNLNGIGLHYCFDKRFNRLIITKLDYKKIHNDVVYDKNTKSFNLLENNVLTPISLNNPKYFCNKSWTISYSFYQKSWVSYHSYIPNFYIDHIDTFDSGYKTYNGQKLYTHNVGNKSYQVFYGKLYPFIVEVPTKSQLDTQYLLNIEYQLDVIRYHNEYDAFYNRTKTFNKCIVYNNYQTSGLLEFKVSDPEDLTESINYPQRTTNGIKVTTTNSENIWRFNDFFDVTENQLNNIPIFNYDCNNVDKKLNIRALDYNKFDYDRALIRNKACRVRFINDIESNYKFIFNVAEFKQNQSIR